MPNCLIFYNSMRMLELDFVLGDFPHSQSLPLSPQVSQLALKLFSLPANSVDTLSPLV